MSLAKPIIRPSLHTELVDRLRELIIEDQLEPGEKIPERTLCESFAVSRTPLREALKVLASEGLVKLEPNRGARVTRVTIEELSMAFPVLAALEAVAGELACKRIKAAEISAIRRYHDAMMRHFEKGDRSAYFKANQKIHDAILAAAGNAILSQQHQSVATIVRRARYLANADGQRWAQAISEHVEILEALQARDGSRLANLMRQHQENKFASLLRGENSVRKSELG